MFIYGLASFIYYTPWSYLHLLASFVMSVDNQQQKCNRTLYVHDVPIMQRISMFNVYKREFRVI